MKLSGTVQKMKFSVKDFLSKCDQIRRNLRIWSHLLKKSLMENFIFYAVRSALFLKSFHPNVSIFFERSHGGGLYHIVLVIYSNLTLNNKLTVSKINSEHFRTSLFIYIKLIQRFCY